MCEESRPSLEEPTDWPPSGPWVSMCWPKHRRLCQAGLLLTFHRGQHDMWVSVTTESEPLTQMSLSCRPILKHSVHPPHWCKLSMLTPLPNHFLCSPGSPTGRKTNASISPVPAHALPLSPALVESWLFPEATSVGPVCSDLKWPGGGINTHLGPHCHFSTFCLYFWAKMKNPKRNKNSVKFWETWHPGNLFTVCFLCWSSNGGQLSHFSDILSLKWLALHCLCLLPFSLSTTFNT